MSVQCSVQVVQRAAWGRALNLAPKTILVNSTHSSIMGLKNMFSGQDTKLVPSEPEITEYAPALPEDLNYIPVLPEPVKYDPVAPPSYPAMEMQEIILTKGLTGMSTRAFASENSMRLYKEYTKLLKKHQDFPRAKQNQNNSIGMPLIVSKRAMNLGLGDSTFLKFFECAPAPEAADRLYDKVDNRPIGEALKRKFIGYDRYRLHIKGVETVVIAHTRLPIVDLQINNERFRFVKAVTPLMNPDHFVYELYLLSPEQKSLVDDMGSSLKVTKSNPLLGGQLHNFFPLKLGPSDRSKYVSLHKVGVFEYHRSWEMFKQMKKCLVFSMYTFAAGNPDSNNAVEFRTLILVAVTLILQSHEDDLQGGRAAVN